MRALVCRLVAAALVACSFAASASAADPFSINVLVPETGALAFIGTQQVEVLHVLEGVVNRDGGIRGRPIAFVFHDDTSSPQVAVQLASQLAAEKVPVILGPSLAASCSAVYALTQRTGPVTWCYSGVAQPEPHSYAFVYAPSIPDVQSVVVRYYYQRGARNFALITSTDASGQIFENTFGDALGRLEFRGIKLVAHERFNTTDLSVSAQLSRIKAAKPDVLITYTSGTPFGNLLHGISDAGLDVPVYGSGANLGARQIVQYSAFLPKDLVLNGAQGLQPDPNALVQVKRRQTVFFNAMKKAGLHVEYGHSLTWDPTLLTIDALRVLGTDTTATQLHDYIEHLRNWVGIQGVYNFSSGDQRGLGENGVALFRWNAGKKDFDLVATGPRFL